VKNQIEGSIKVGDTVIVKIEQNRGYRLSTEKVLKINKLTYSISLGDDDYVLISKISLLGYPQVVINDRTGDGRRFVGRLVKLIEINNKE
jgi:hypothetical protein